MFDFVLFHFVWKNTVIDWDNGTCTLESWTAIIPCKKTVGVSEGGHWHDRLGTYLNEVYRRPLSRPSTANFDTNKLLERELQKCIEKTYTSRSATSKYILFIRLCQQNFIDSARGTMFFQPCYCVNAISSSRGLLLL